MTKNGKRTGAGKITPMTDHQWFIWKLHSLMIRSRYVVITGFRPLRIPPQSLVQLSLVIAVQTGELQDLVGMIRVTVVEVLQIVVEAGAEEREAEAMTGAKGPEGVAPLGPLLRPEVNGRLVHQVCPVDLVEANNEL